jgi:hypothetical protein
LFIAMNINPERSRVKMLTSDRAKCIKVKSVGSKIMNKLSSFLYARPSFAEGAARLIDFGNTLQEYNTALSANQADCLAMKADWRVVGDDLRIVISRFSELEPQVDELVIEAQKELANTCE